MNRQLNIIYNEIQIWNNPVLIWDVLDYLSKIKDKQELESTQYYAWLYDIICIQWRNKREPIEEQSDKCIEYIYNLIK